MENQDQTTRIANTNTEDKKHVREKLRVTKQQLEQAANNHQHQKPNESDVNRENSEQASPDDRIHPLTGRKVTPTKLHKVVQSRHLSTYRTS